MWIMTIGRSQGNHFKYDNQINIFINIKLHGVEPGRSVRPRPGKLFAFSPSSHQRHGIPFFVGALFFSPFFASCPAAERYPPVFASDPTFGNDLSVAGRAQVAIAPARGDAGGGVQNDVRLATAVTVSETLCGDCVRMCLDVMDLLFGVAHARALAVV